MQNLKNLKSGSDIRGIALGENINLTNDAVKSIAMAFVKFLEKNKNIAIKNQTIAVGHVLYQLAQMFITAVYVQLLLCLWRLKCCLVRLR